MIEVFILGIVQGIIEWLPLSSEGATIAVKNIFFPDEQSLNDLIQLSLFLHLGTFFAALIYFKKEVLKLIKNIFQPREKDPENRKILWFLIISTPISGALGFSLLTILKGFEEVLVAGSVYINILIGLMLLITAFLQMRPARTKQPKGSTEIRLKDSILLGVVQGFAVIPGLSRSGLTVSTLLLRNFNDVLALKLSFLMSLPIVLAGNIVLNMGMFQEGITSEIIIALVASFLAGLLTIHLLLKVAKKINFAYFTLGFAILVILGAFI